MTTPEASKAVELPRPYTYAYQYHDCIRFTGGVEHNGERPSKAIAMYSEDQVRELLTPSHEAGTRDEDQQNTFADMLWKWFEDESRIGADGMRPERLEGLSADDFKIMLDEHEAALLPAKAGTQEPVAWRPVTDFEGLYEVSNLGDIRSVKSGRTLGKPLAGDGYAKAELWKNNQRTQTYHHRVVARAFLGEPSVERPEINHKDGNKLNNAASNLEWASRSENVRHAMYELGTNVKPVVATDDDGTEEFYPSIEAAGRSGYTAASIYGCLYGKRKKHGGKTWRFANPAAPTSQDATRADRRHDAIYLRGWDEAVEECAAAFEKAGSGFGEFSVQRAAINLGLTFVRALASRADRAVTADERDEPDARHDEVALQAARSIIAINEAWPYARKSAHIQCIILDVITKCTNAPTTAEDQTEPDTSRVLEDFYRDRAWKAEALIKKIDYALRKDSFCDAERIESARQLVAGALSPPTADDQKFPNEAVASTSAPSRTVESMPRGPAACDGQNAAAVGLTSATATNSSSVPPPNGTES